MKAADELRVLGEEAAGCVACGLAETRTQVVFGVGAFDADLMFVGEAPGRNEDLQGEPFVGAAGKLLDDLLGEIGIARDDVYIANVLKCRPPGNRDPRPDEIEACKGYLRRQLELIDPRVVMTLGNFATKLLVPTDVGITRMRGQKIDWWLGATLVPTFHPAAALRGRPRVKEQMQEDFEQVRSLLENAPVAEDSSEMEPTQQRLGLGR